MSEVASLPSILERDGTHLDSFLRSVSAHPEQFVVPSKKLSGQAMKITKILFDHAKSEEADTIGTVGNLTELIVDGFDSEQVWQELELQNQPLLEHLSGITGALLDDEEDIDLEADFNVDFEEGEEDEEQEDDFDEEEGMPGLEEYEDGSDADHSEGSDDYNSEEREMQEKVRRMREKAREEEGEDDESITSDEDEQERQRTKRNNVKSVLDDEFFDLEEMNRFADVGESYGGVGETYGGLITNLGDNDDEEMYELMYGSGSSSKKRKDKDDAHDLKPKKSRKNEGGLFGNAEELDSEDEQLQAALQQARKEFGAESGDEEDGEAGFGDGDDDGSDLDGEEAYYEDFFEDPDPSRARRSRASEAESRDAKRMDDEDAAYYHDDDDGEALDGEDDDLQEDDIDGADQDGDEQDDDQELSSYQKEMRRKERELRALEQGMMAEDARDEKTMLSTGDLGVSGFEMSQRRMQQRIEGLENELVGKKKWATLGEAKSGQRGLNTLLEEDLEFDIALKAAPLVTAEFTKRIEDMIKKRIVDQVFDDPVKKLGKPEQGDYRPRTAELDQEKSEKSLAQIYEDDYVRQIEGVKDQDKLSQEHKDCVGLFKSICYRMDALSNANFTPYKVREEVEVVAHKDAAAIQMEEVMPMTVSDAAVLAPEEVYRPAKTAVRGDSEYTTDEKKAMRRDRKRKHAKEEVEKKAEERRQAILHPEKAFKRKPSIAQALKLISKDSHTTISANTDKTKYSSTGAFKKIASASTTDQ